MRLTGTGTPPLPIRFGSYQPISRTKTEYHRYWGDQRDCNYVSFPLNRYSFNHLGLTSPIAKVDGYHRAVNCHLKNIFNTFTAYHHYTSDFGDEYQIHFPGIDSSWKSYTHFRNLFYDLEKNIKLALSSQPKDPAIPFIEESPNAQEHAHTKHRCYYYGDYLKKIPELIPEFMSEIYPTRSGNAILPLLEKLGVHQDKINEITRSAAKLEAELIAYYTEHGVARNLEPAVLSLPPETLSELALKYTISNDLNPSTFETYMEAQQESRRLNLPRFSEHAEARRIRYLVTPLRKTGANGLTLLRLLNDQDPDRGWVSRQAKPGRLQTGLYQTLKLDPLDSGALAELVSQLRYLEQAGLIREAPDSTNSGKNRWSLTAEGKKRLAFKDPIEAFGISSVELKVMLESELARLDFDQDRMAQIVRAFQQKDQPTSKLTPIASASHQRWKKQGEEKKVQLKELLRKTEQAIHNQKIAELTDRFEQLMSESNRPAENASSLLIEFIQTQYHHHTAVIDEHPENRYLDSKDEKTPFFG